MSQPAQPEPSKALSYSLLFPRGWRQFSVDALGEKKVSTAATRQAKEAGRSDVVLVIRQYVHGLFEALRRQGAIAVHLPVETAMIAPVSLAVVPLIAGLRTLDEAVVRASRGHDLERLDVDATTWYRWYEPHPTVEGSRELDGVSLHYVIPRPGGTGEAGLRLIYTVVGLAQSEEKAEERETWLNLAHVIVGSFQWRTTGAVSHG